MSSEKLKILIIEDNLGDIRLIQEYLSFSAEKYTLVPATSLAEGLDAITNGNFDVILLDLGLPDSKGLTTLEKILSNGQNTPVVVLTGLDDQEFGITALKTGAQDFLNKNSIDTGVLEKTIKYAYERAKIEKELKKRTSTIELLFTASQQINQSLEIDQIYRSISNTINEILPCEALYIWNYDSDSNFLKCVFATHNGIIKDDNRLDHKIDQECLHFQTLQSGEPKLFNNPKLISSNESQSSHSLLDNASVTATIISPIIHNNQTIGLLQIITTQEKGYNEEDIHLIAALSSQIAVAANNSSLFQQSVQSAAETSRLYRATEALLSEQTQDTQVLAKKIVNLILEEFGQTNCSLLMVNPNNNEIFRLAVSGAYKHEVSQINLKIDGDGIVPHTIRTGKLTNISDVSQSNIYTPSWKDAKSELAIPIKVNGKVIGVIDIQSTQLNAFSPEDERVMVSFAEQAGIAFENARLLQQTHKRLRQLEALRDIDLAITSNIDLELTMSVIINQVQYQLAVDAVGFMTLDETGKLRYRFSKGFSTHAYERLIFGLGEGIAGKVALEQEKKFIQNYTTESIPLAIQNLMTDEEFITYACIPVTTKGEIIGILDVFSKKEMNPLPEWWAFFETLAGQAAIAFDNAHLSESQKQAQLELEIAYQHTLEGWVKALDMRDKETEGHTQRVTEITLHLAHRLGIKGENLIQFRRGALLHDIGKMGIPDEILHKPGPLTDEEWVLMKQHPVFARNFLTSIEYLTPALDIPYYHHEKWDGSGYPEGLKGEQIPLSARVFAIVDVWDALSNDRPYRKAWPEEKAIEYIKEQSGKHFDPKIVKVFLELIREEKTKENF